MKQDQIIAWIKSGLSKQGKNASGLARALKRNPSAVTQILKGNRRVQDDELLTISAYLEELPPTSWLRNTTVTGEIIPADATTTGFPIVGVAEAGAFREMAVLPIKSDKVIAAVDPRYPHAQHVAYIAQGDSMDKVGINPGDIVICVVWEDTFQTKPRDGQIVVVERSEDGGKTVELSLRGVANYTDRVEYQPRSSSDRHQTIVVPVSGDLPEGRSVKVVALAVRNLSYIPT